MTSATLRCLGVCEIEKERALEEVVPREDGFEEGVGAVWDAL